MVRGSIVVYTFREDNLLINNFVYRNKLMFSENNIVIVSFAVPEKWLVDEPFFFFLKKNFI